MRATRASAASGSAPRHMKGQTGGSRQMSCWRVRTAADAIKTFPATARVGCEAFERRAPTDAITKSSARALDFTSPSGSGVAAPAAGAHGDAHFPGRKFLNNKENAGVVQW